MIRAAIAFFVLALVAYVLGASGIAGLSLDIGKILLGVFLVLAIISFIAGLAGGRRTGALAIAGLMSIPVLGTSAFAEETVVEKVETKTNETVDSVKEAGRDVDEKVCETVNGKLHCVGKKIKNAAKKAGDKIETKAKDLKKKVD